MRGAGRASRPLPRRKPRFRRICGWGFAIAIAGLLVLTAIVVAKSSKGTTRSATLTLASASSSVTGVQCPNNTHATGGGLAVVTGSNPATQGGTQTHPQTNYPPGKMKWRAGASSLSGEPAANLTAYVRCENKSFGKITARVERSTTLASGIGRTISVVCPAGTQVLGGGYSVSPTFSASAKNNTTSKMAILQSRRTSASSWTVSALNPSQPTSQLTVSALCEKNGKQISTKTAFSPLAGKSRQTVTAKCSGKQHVDAGGFSVTPLFSNVGVPVVDTSFPSDSQSWRVEVYGPANIPTGSGITAFAYCKPNKPPG
jgi:hypothetical protein